MKKLVDMVEEIIDTGDVTATIVVNDIKVENVCEFTEIMNDIVKVNTTVYGYVFNDKKKRGKDGAGIVTSRVMSYEPTILNNAFKIQTLNNRYLVIFEM